MPRTTDGHEIPALTVDAVVLRRSPETDDVEVLLVRRGRPPFVDTWALPGGFVDAGETVERACVREAREETRIDVQLLGLLGVYSAPDRDPRHHTVTVAFLATCGPDARPRGQDDAAAADWFPLAAPPELAFDHADILHDAQRRVEADTLGTSL